MIAVDLNSRIVSRTKNRRVIPEKGDGEIQVQLPEMSPETGVGTELIKKMGDYYDNIEQRLRQKTSDLLHREAPPPDIIETVMTSVGIMQERITRINLAVDQPDILIQPRLGELKLMNFDQIEHTIEEGYIATKEQIEDILPLLETEMK